MARRSNEGKDPCNQIILLGTRKEGSMLAKLFDEFFRLNKGEIGMLKGDPPIYEVVIKMTKVEETKGGGHWDTIGTDEKGNDKRGYTPEIIHEKEIIREVYRQAIDDLDLSLVIKAVNKL